MRRSQQSMIVIAFIIVALGRGCIISGKDSGYCAQSPLDSSSFCGSQINEYVCVPAHNSTWSKYNAAYKDTVIEQIFMSIFQQQLIDEYQNSNSTLLITNNPACYNAYWKFVCQWNFPACSPSNTSQPLCASVCTNFYSSCGSNAEACSILLDSIV